MPRVNWISALPNGPITKWTMGYLAQYVFLRKKLQLYSRVLLAFLLFCPGTSFGPVAAQAPSTDQSQDSVALPDVESVNQTQVHDGVEYAERASLERVRQLIELGTIQLAHQIVIDERPYYHNSLEEFQWEELFFELSSQLQAWDKIIRRADEVSQAEIYSLAQTHAIRAEIYLHQYDSAIKRIRNLILQRPEDRSLIIDLRALVAQIFVEEGHLADAEIALTLFDRDYRPSAPEWEHRYVRVLFLSDRYNDAFSRLAPLQTLESQLLELYGQYRTQAIGPAEVVLRGLEIEPQYSAQPALHAELWGLINLAAQSYKDFEMQTIAIESGLAVNYKLTSKWEHLPVVPLVSEQTLLDAYDQFATVIGNDIGLIIGDDASWYQLAQEFEITSSTTARALHAYLARHAYTEASRERSTQALANLLFEAGLYELLDLLFVRTNLFDISKVSEETKTRLANAALREKEYGKALKVINVMPEPQDADALESWRLTQARIAIAIEDYDKSETLLTELIEHLPLNPPQDSIDRIVQVIFDLQDREQHKLAVQIFIYLFNQASENQSKREILRWISESYSASGDYPKASEHLLQSAMLGGNWDDEWGLSARLQAADEMVRAGFIGDARVIFTQLHEDTIDPRNRSLIANRLNNLPPAVAGESH